jgi:hypothetical protein
MMATLRQEFEPHLLSPDGLHPDAASCAKAWNVETSSDERLEGMISLAEEWLKLCTKSRMGVNKRVPSSFGLSKICERYHGGARVLNGPFLMACHRLGFMMEQQPPRFVAKLGRDDCNAWISVCSWPGD